MKTCMCNKACVNNKLENKLSSFNKVKKKKILRLDYLKKWSWFKFNKLGNSKIAHRNAFFQMVATNLYCIHEIIYSLVVKLFENNLVYL